MFVPSESTLNGYLASKSDLRQTDSGQNHMAVRPGAAGNPSCIMQASAKAFGRDRHSPLIALMGYDFARVGAATGLYDRHNDQIIPDEVERIAF